MRKRYNPDEIRLIEERIGKGVSCSEVASELGVDLRSLYNAIHRYGLKVCRKPADALEDEEWRPLPHIPDIDVSSRGRFRRSSTNSLIDGFTTTGGYTTVDFSGVGRFAAHRLVADTFIPNPENKPEVNHRDGNKGHNGVDNLEWVTPSENVRHSFETGLNVAKSGFDHPRAAMTPEEAARCTELKASGKTYTEIGSELGFSRKIVSRYVNKCRENM